MNEYSRRAFLGSTAAASAALALGVITEPMLAAQDLQPPHVEGGVLINANENPLGPCAAARTALTNIIPQAGRYRFDLRHDLMETFASSFGLKSDQVLPFAGSSEPLHFTIIAYTSPTKSFVNANPTYEAGFMAARARGAREVKVPLTAKYAHDVKAMLAAAPDAGVFYICSPNNPTGTVTPHEDIEYLVEHKPKGSIVMVDEAYLHFCDEPSAIDLVKAGKDIVVLRTFSKIYGMAGVRCGFAIARPDILSEIDRFAGENPMPVTACAAAIASLKDATVVPERKQQTAKIRAATFAWLDQNGYKYIPSQSNCFLLETGRTGREVIAAMAKQNVYIGRVWPIYPTHVRITIGTSDEMEQFQVAFDKVMKGKAQVGALTNHDLGILANHDGREFRG
jgi:histidinol-phosphate aminotransferase